MDHAYTKHSVRQRWEYHVLVINRSSLRNFAKLYERRMHFPKIHNEFCQLRIKLPQGYEIPSLPVTAVISFSKLMKERMAGYSYGFGIKSDNLWILPFPGNCPKLINRLVGSAQFADR